MFLSFRAIFCFANMDYRLIRMTSPPINPDEQGFTVYIYIWVYVGILYIQVDI
jgi:hypothetical protein